MLLLLLLFFETSSHFLLLLQFFLYCYVLRTFVFLASLLVYQGVVERRDKVLDAQYRNGRLFFFEK